MDERNYIDWCVATPMLLRRYNRRKVASMVFDNINYHTSTSIISTDTEYLNYRCIIHYKPH